MIELQVILHSKQKSQKNKQKIVDKKIVYNMDCAVPCPGAVQNIEIFGCVCPMVLVSPFSTKCTCVRERERERPYAEPGVKNLRLNPVRSRL